MNLEVSDYKRESNRFSKRNILAALGLVALGLVALVGGMY